MFGGVDQVLRQTHGGDDWWINDQRQLASGFSQWPTDYDVPAWTTATPVSPTVAQQHTTLPQSSNGRFTPGNSHLITQDLLPGGFDNGHQVQNGITNGHVQNGYYFPGGMEYPNESEWYQ
jgi:hypothetical protein